MKLFDGKNITKEFFLFLKHNRFIDKDNIKDYSNKDYNEFNNLLTSFIQAMENNNPNASEFLGALMTFLGFSRKYCSLCGKPIIGKYYKLNNRITCNNCYAAYSVIKQIENN